MKRRDLVNRLKQAGYRELREGDHTTFYNPHPIGAARKLVQVPRHTEINEITAKQILKDAGLR